VTTENGKRAFQIRMTLYAEDHYNFKPGAKDIATGTPDDENGQFELTGLGHEFKNTSSLRRHIEFSADVNPIPDPRKSPAVKKVSEIR
jgi:hypothetical protein